MAKKDITNKEHIIIVLLLIFRFINSKQIQEFLGHKDHRRINSWLKDLVEKGYIERDFTPIYGTLTKPAVYTLSVKGRKYTRQSYVYHFPAYLKRISRDAKASKSFRIRCQIIADWYLTLFPPSHPSERASVTVQKGTSTGVSIADVFVHELTTDSGNTEEKIPMNKLQFFTPAYFPSFILLEKIKPDSYLRKRTVKGVTHGLLFVLDAYIPRLLLRYKMKHIFEMLDEENWEDDTIQALHVYVLCPNHAIIIYLQRLLRSYFENYYGGKELLFFFMTRNALYDRKYGKTDRMKWVTVSSTDE
jgi:hypothetical protein